MHEFRISATVIHSLGPLTGLVLISAAAAVALWSHASSYPFRAVSLRSAALRHVRSSAFYTKAGKESFEENGLRFPWVP